MFARAVIELQVISALVTRIIATVRQKTRCYNTYILHTNIFLFVFVRIYVCIFYDEYYIKTKKL